MSLCASLGNGAVAHGFACIALGDGAEAIGMYRIDVRSPVTVKATIPLDLCLKKLEIWRKGWKNLLEDGRIDTQFYKDCMIALDQMESIVRKHCLEQEPEKDGEKSEKENNPPAPSPPFLL